MRSHPGQPMKQLVDNSREGESRLKPPQTSAEAHRRVDLMLKYWAAAENSKLSVDARYEAAVRARALSHQVLNFIAFRVRDELKQKGRKRA